MILHIPANFPAYLQRQYAELGADTMPRSLGLEKKPHPRNTMGGGSELRRREVAQGRREASNPSCGSPEACQACGSYCPALDMTVQQMREE